ncbi:MAG: 50S ribosomal protein L9, partial [Candidatus Hydrogenedentes bacterium]|nr:50S ribosomal protein L9 [Candidatus Hydrogenedentota bacterium]
MKVILCENVSNLGDMGATVNVADGYARNYLIPRKLAVSADSASAKQIEHEMRIIRAREEKQRAALAEVAKQIEGLTIE